MKLYENAKKKKKKNSNLKRPTSELRVCLDTVGLVDILLLSFSFQNYESHCYKSSLITSASCDTARSLNLAVLGNGSGTLVSKRTPSFQTATRMKRCLILLICAWQSSRSRSNFSIRTTVISAEQPTPSEPITSRRPIAAAGVMVTALMTPIKGIPTCSTFVITVNRSYAGPSTHSRCKSELIISGQKLSFAQISATVHENEPRPWPTSNSTPLFRASWTSLCTCPVSGLMMVLAKP